MTIRLGNVELDEGNTTVHEVLEEAGGGDYRVIKVSGLIVNKLSVTEINDSLDAILCHASDSDFEAELSVRDDRVMYVRREKFEREISPGNMIGSFVLLLKSKDPFEHAETENSAVWNVSSSGATLSVEAGGSVYSKPVLSLVAVGDVVNPGFSDGQRSIVYEGVVADGETLVLNAVNGQVLLEDVDVTPYTTGGFPRLAPGDTTLVYADDVTSSHGASIIVSWRDRWV